LHAISPSPISKWAGDQSNISLHLVFSIGAGTWSDVTTHGEKYSRAVEIILMNRFSQMAAPPDSRFPYALLCDIFDCEKMAVPFAPSV
jgi:hypothetical protein